MYLLPLPRLVLPQQDEGRTCVKLVLTELYFISNSFFLYQIPLAILHRFTQIEPSVKFDHWDIQDLQIWPREVLFQ